MNYKSNIRKPIVCELNLHFYNFRILGYQHIEKRASKLNSPKPPRYQVPTVSMEQHHMSSTQSISVTHQVAFYWSGWKACTFSTRSRLILFGRLCRGNTQMQTSSAFSQAINCKAWALWHRIFSSELLTFLVC